MTLFEVLSSAADTLPSRVLAALGIGWVSYEGYKTLVDELITQLMASYNAMPIAVYQLLSLGGFTDGLGILLGAFAARASLFAVSHFGKVT